MGKKKKKKKEDTQKEKFKKQEASGRVRRVLQVIGQLLENGSLKSLWTGKAVKHGK